VQSSPFNDAHRPSRTDEMAFAQLVAAHVQQFEAVELDVTLVLAQLLHHKPN